MATGDVDATGWELENTAAGHSKFYRVIVAGAKVLLNWGAIGSSGQYKVHEPGNDRAANAKAVDQTNDKATGGYLQSIGGTRFTISRTDFDAIANGSTRNAEVVKEFLAASGAAGTRSHPRVAVDVGALRLLLATPAAPTPAPAPPAPAARRSRGPRLAPVGPCARPNGETYTPRAVGDHEDIALLRKAQQAAEHVLLAGPPGTGKTALIEAAFPAAEQIVGTADTTEADFVGSWVQDPHTAGYVWAPGPLQRSVEADVPLFVDEVALIDPRVLSVLYAPMDGRGELRVTANPTLPPLKIGPNWFALGAYNPDVPGVMLSDALRDRFDHHIDVGSDFQLAREMGVPDDIVTVAENLDGRRLRGEISWSPQLRTLLKFARQADQYGVKHAVNALVSKAPAADRTVIIDGLKARFRNVEALRLGGRFDA